MSAAGAPGTGAEATTAATIAAVLERLRGRRPAVFLDFDGTLAEIVAHPDRAVLDPAMREAIVKLAARWPVAVISGRDLADVEARVGVEGIHYAGSHGFDIVAAGPGQPHAHPDGVAALPELDRAERALRERLAGVEGVLVERKRFSIAVHFRNALAGDVPRIQDSVDTVLDAHQALRKGHGKKVFELRPDTAWDKGKAVRWLLRALELERPEVMPVYVGDDATDEDAFRELASDGICVAVMDPPRPTLAPYRLPAPSAVRRLIEVLATLPRAD